MTAFDLTAWGVSGGPDPALIEDCVHCGFCLPTCPTYELWGEEMDSPRGRIQLMALGHEQPELSEAIVTHLDRCLGCMACVTACPSGVRYDVLLTQARAAIERGHERSRGERALRRLLFATLTHPARLRVLIPLLALARPLRPERALAGRAPRLAAAAALAPPVRLSAAWQRLPAFTPARGERRGSVGFLQGCVQRAFFGHVNAATVRVLAAEGFDVHAPAAPRCCGSLQLHSGEEDDARERARETIAALGHCELVVTNAAGCGSGMKDYARLLGATDFAAKVRDVHELLAEAAPRAERHPLALRVAHHDACHLAHAQGVRDQPRELLRGIPGLELVEPPEWELCCGSAGIHNLMEPDAAAELGRRKAANLGALDVDAIAAANPGCAVQIARYLERPIPVVHPMELLDRSLRAR